MYIYINFVTKKYFQEITDLFFNISVTNEIPDYPLNSIQPTEPTNVLDDGVCIVCEFAMQYIDKAIGNEKTRDKIEKVVHGVCNHLPKTVATDCNHFVDEYADVVISILSKDVSPKEVCTMIGLCKTSIQQLRGTLFLDKLIRTNRYY